MEEKHKILPVSDVKRYSLKERKSKVVLEIQGKPYVEGSSFGDFLATLPSVLAARDFATAVEAIVRARDNSRPVILAMGAHPIKVGLSPVIINLMRNGTITALVTNGACLVHDFEMAFAGHTSEDVAEELCKGSFGMAEETGKYVNRAIVDGVNLGYGLGRSMGSFLAAGSFPSDGPSLSGGAITSGGIAKYDGVSLYAEAYRLGLPATVHVAIGTDIVHMHPEADGGAIGEGSMRDFRLLASVVADLSGGVYINLGSAVILPEVFLKALNLARNLGYEVENFTAIVMDFIRQYRAETNVLRRPTMHSGKAISLIGHHEIMFSLLAAAIIEKKGKKVWK
ncbi:MAG: deoxyhypusine synthase family protein [Nitrospirae bacterium]|nr:deoxyhypusine synthase family protein [Nitrospirota bacterium]